MSVFLVLVATVIAGGVVHFIMKMYRLNEMVKDLPKIPLGLTRKMLTANKTSIDSFHVLEKALGFHNGLAKFWIGPTLAVVCDDPENMKLILMSKNCVDKPYLYRLIGGAGEGIFASHGDMWKSDRKHINTVFTLSILKTFIPIFNSHFARFVKNLDKNVGQPEFDMTDFMFSCNLDIVCETILRFDSRTQYGENKDAVNLIARNWKIAETRVTALLLHPDFIYRRTSLYAEEQSIINYFLDIGPQILRNAHNLHATNLSNQSEKSAACDDDAPKSMILIDKLIEMERQGLIEYPRLIDQIHTFIVAGTDTGSVTMLSVLLMLAINQDVQERVYEEISANVSDVEALDYDTLTKLEYMDRTIKETMRMFPLAQILLRQTDEDVQLTECIIPKGTVLVLSVFKMHRNKEIWGPTADEFDPERFLPESSEGRHPYAYLPFSAGPRNCIGAKYAMIAMKMMLCHMLTAYKLSTSIQMSDIILKFELLLKLDTKCLVKLDRRQ